MIIDFGVFIYFSVKTVNYCKSLKTLKKTVKEISASPESANQKPDEQNNNNHNEK